MTDLEMTRLCAEAMEYMVEMRETPFTESGVKIMFAGPYDGRIEPWNPLRDDAQAMALVKKYPVETISDLYDLIPHGRYGGVRFVPLSQDLNRAIVECVAKMQAAKK